MSTGGETGPDAPKVEPTDGITPMPEDGDVKFYNAETGDYSWENAFKEAKFNEGGRKEVVPPEGTPPAIPPDTPPATPTVKTPVVPAEGAKPDADLAREQMGADYDGYFGEIEENGILSEGSYKELSEKYGHNKRTVDTYIRGMEATVADIREAGMEITSGEDNFNAMASWATENLTKAEAAAYNVEADSGDIARVKAAVTGLYAKYADAEGFVPTYINGGDGGGHEGGTYSSWQEVQRDMKSGTLYAEGDPAEQARVQAKLDRSNL